MNETLRPRRMARSIGAVLAGVLVIVVLSVATDVVLHATGVFPPLGQPMSDALFLLATAYRTVYGVAGATSRPGSPRTGPCGTPWRLAP